MATKISLFFRITPFFNIIRIEPHATEKFTYKLSPLGSRNKSNAVDDQEASKEEIFINFFWEFKREEREKGKNLLMEQ